MDYTNPFFPQEDFTIPIPNPNQHPSVPIQVIRRDSYNPLNDHMANSMIGIPSHSQGHIISPVEDVEDLDTSSRPRLTQDQIAVLEAEFKGKPKPGTEYKKALAYKIGLSLQRVNNWYQNRRAKARHQRPQERRFDVLPADPNDPNNLPWAASNVFSSFQNGQEEFHDLNDLDDQMLPVDFMTIPSDELTELSKSISPELAHTGVNLPPSSSNTLREQGELDDSKVDPLFMSNVNSIPGSKMPMSYMPDLYINSWVTDIQQEIPLHHDELMAIGPHFNAYPDLMYQSSVEGLSIGNPSCQTLVTTSSSDGDPCLLTPPPKTSPMPPLPQESIQRRGSNSSDLAHEINTIRLQQTRPRPGQYDNMFCPPPTSELGQSAENTPEFSQPQKAVSSSPTLLGLSKTSEKTLTLPRQDLASRRKRPRPATLRPDAQRSRSYAGPLTMSPNSKCSSMGLAPSPSVRRIKSTGQNMNVVGGRVQKSGTISAQLSPRNFQSYIEGSGLSHPRFPERQSIAVPKPSAPNCPPLTPLSPGKLDFQQETWSNCSPYIGPSFTAWDQNHDQMAPTFFEAKHEITSPPITPFNKDAFPQLFPQERTFYHCPPQSAPPQQTTFFRDSSPIRSSNIGQPSWHLPSSNLPVDAYAEDHRFSRPNPMSQFVYSESQLPVMGPPQHYLSGPSPTPLGLPKFYGARTPEKEIEIQVKLIPKPQGAPQARKKYHFSHTTPKDFSQSVYT